MDARKCVHAQKPYSSDIRAWIRQSRRKRRGKTEDRRLMERKAAQQNKNLSEELKQGLPRIAQVSNAGGITLTFPLATECAHLRLKCFYLLQDSHYSNNVCWRHGCAHIDVTSQRIFSFSRDMPCVEPTSPVTATPFNTWQCPSASTLRCLSWMPWIWWNL